MKTLLMQPQEEIFYHQPRQGFDVAENQIIPKPLPPITQYIIEQLLATKRFTKTSIAKELQVSLVTINRWAIGSIKHPIHKTFSRLLTLYCATQKILMMEERMREETIEAAA